MKKMTKTEIAEHFNVSLTTVDAWLRRGCPGEKIGRTWDFDLGEVSDWQSLNCRGSRIRIDVDTAKGYTLKQFVDVFARYLSPATPIQSVTMSQPTPVKDLQGFQNVTQEDAVTFENHWKPAPVNECDVVTFEKAPGRGEGIREDEKEGVSDRENSLLEGII